MHVSLSLSVSHTHTQTYRAGSTAIADYTQAVIVHITPPGGAAQTGLDDGQIGFLQNIGMISIWKRCSKSKHLIMPL